MFENIAFSAYEKCEKEPRLALQNLNPRFKSGRRRQIPKKSEAL
jgi:hypothetical protein